MKSLTKNYLFKILLMLGVVIIDIVTKILLFGKSFVIIPFILGVRPLSTLNTGGAWGFLGDHLILLIGFTLVFLALVMLLETKWKNTNKLYSVALSFIVGGAIGNFIDRIFLGGVRDFLYFPFFDSFPTFNVADSFLCVGIILLVLYVLFFYKENNA